MKAGPQQFLLPEFIRRTLENRLYRLPVPVVGLTGGIATGKSSVTNLLRSLGFDVIDADQLVKEIYQGPVIRSILERECPTAVSTAGIDFPLLRKMFFTDPELQRNLEAQIYQELPEAFLRSFVRLSGPAFVFYDVPLLFEKNLGAKMDLTIVVYAPRELQRKRLVLRDGTAPALVEEILARQWDIEQKKQLADFVIDNTGSEAQLQQEVLRIIRTITTAAG